MKNNNVYRQTALIGGIAYLILFATGIYANFFVLEKLIVKGNAIETYDSFSKNINQLRVAIPAFIIMVISDLIVTWVLYTLFKSTNESLSKLTAWFRLINVTIFGIALFHLLETYSLISNAEYSIAYGKKILAIETYRTLQAFNYTWLLGLIFFGMHLILLSVLIKYSRKTTRYISIFLLIAGIGYVVDSMLHFFYKDYTSLEHISALIVVLPGIIGELALTFWLLLKAEKKQLPISHSN